MKKFSSEFKRIYTSERIFYKNLMINLKLLISSSLRSQWLNTFKKILRYWKWNPVTRNFCLETLFSYPLDSDLSIFAWLQQSHHQILKNWRQFLIAALPELLIKALQALKETLEDCEFFIITNIYRFHVSLLKLLSPQLNDQTDSESLLRTLLRHSIYQDHSLKPYNDQHDI